MPDRDPWGEFADAPPAGKSATPSGSIGQVTAPADAAPVADARPFVPIADAEPFAAPDKDVSGEAWFPIYSKLRSNPVVLKSPQLPTDPRERDRALRNAAQGLYLKMNPNAQFGRDFGDSIDRQGGWGMADDTRRFFGADDRPYSQKSYLAQVDTPIRNFIPNVLDLAYRGYQTLQGGVEAGAIGFDRSLDETGLPDLVERITGNRFEPGHGLLALMEALPDGGMHMGFVAPKLDTLPAKVRASLNDEATTLFTNGASRGDMDAWAKERGLGPWSDDLTAAIAERDRTAGRSDPASAADAPPGPDIVITASRRAEGASPDARAPRSQPEPPGDMWDEFTDAPGTDLPPSADRAQAMANDLERPTLAGPRAVDRIDVTAPRPLASDFTDMDRLAAAGRLEPGDVLPVPQSRLGGVEDLDTIAAGRYEDIAAPDEYAGLDTRNLPAPLDNSRTLPKRGPVDLVTFARSQGGLRDEGGELAFSGIDNAPRRVDFAPNENRFGKLVDPTDGRSYEDMAQRAHDAGYFPELSEVPTRDQFLSALTDTHSGANRRFLPDDLPEVDRFYADREQRYAVEAARDAGTPLSRDSSVRTSLEDADRNAAPVEAYSEWGENAPDYAGNINLSKLDSPQGIKRALSQIDRTTGGFDAATRGRITHAETSALANDLGMKPAQLLARRKGQAFNAEEALAARQILAKSGNELVNLARRITSGNASEREIAGWQHAVVRHAAIQEQITGITAEAGRTLSSLRATADSRAVSGDVLRSLIESGGGRDGITDAARVIVDNADDPARLNNVAELIAKPKLKDKLIEIYYNFLLSGPRTHAVNITSNLLTSLAQPAEHLVAAGIGAARKILPGQAATDRVLFSEPGTRMVGMLQGSIEGFGEFGRTMRTGQPSDLASKVEAQSQAAISGVKGSIIRLPTRMLSAEDEFFKAIARRQELVGLAARKAKAEGLKGASLKDRAAELAASPTADMIERADDYARYLTFQRPLGPAGNAGVAFLQKAPILKLFVPFVRTPTNILKFAVERSPAAPLLKEWRADFAAGGARRDLAIARAAVGSGAMVMSIEAARRGLITGGGPADDSAKRLLQADGWQPYSLKVGNRYYSYGRLDPFSTTLGLAADWVDLQSHMTDKQRDDVTGTLAKATLKNLASKTWLLGMSNLADALNDPDRYGQSLVASIGGSVVPALSAQTAQAIDPYQREAQTVFDRIRSRVPGLSSTLPARRNVFGQPIPQGNGGGLWAFSPVYSTERRNDPAIAALLEAGSRVSQPSRSVRGRKLSPLEYNQYQTTAGKLIHDAVDDAVKSPSWRTLPTEDRNDALADLIKLGRATARQQLFGPRQPTSPKVPATDPWAEFANAR